ncbi:homeotic protein spalt-major-like isoform X2 [Cylas formicarius]|uniref:homeotic protein spalt-major-like isoform X2 n=1 Tax=Cylas formicarius TaxID=197179 RepID=UPI002958C741|nr:homeotic protein spalt-major-like isoform X2 [Cylas formicarius]
MSRRKQARPIRLLEDDEVDNAGAVAVEPSTLTDTLGATDVPTDLCDVLMCQRCQEQFTELQEYLTHKDECDKKAIKHDDPAHSDPEDMVISEDDDEDDVVGDCKRIDYARRNRQDAANNNNGVDESPENPDEHFVAGPAAPGHVTLEALQNTKVAVAQFAATAMANNSDNEAALQELAVLQSTLFTLQHQQVLQLQLINQLQHQLQIDRHKEDETPVSPPPSESSPPPKEISREPSPAVEVPPLPPPPALPETDAPTIAPPPQIQPPMCSISSSLASTIITHGNDPPSLDEPNTLEMLQKRAQEVLDNASQGLLATNLADELAFRKSKGSMSPYDSKGRNEPFFKHRCRYCGKVFGSDSALQIHIRSHTGERPYKCNVCGSRFTTKGNLKVHFQRHSAKFPHIKMNPNPVPEHLDKYHPPLLAQLGQQPSLSPGGPPPHPHVGFGGSHPAFPAAPLSLYRPQILPPPELQPPAQRVFPPHPLFIKREEQDVAADLRKPPPVSPPPLPIKNEPETETATLMPKREPHEAGDNEPEQEQDVEQERYGSPPPYDDCSNDSKYSNASHLQEEPENLSNRSGSVTAPLSISTGQRLPAGFSFGQASSPPSSTSSGSLSTFPNSHVPDITKDPAIYTNLLPRPGSNDNSWESLIEVTKTSETSKLQQLVDNIEHKLSDPNQCVICHRVLSCKSALQMHYRTHTGERPFKCKICGRAFTTKGNLKTHMGVHRAKPPMRVLHQCPVCHKKFTNALVLQQHIRLHTGEPTDLTPEQIQAAEVKDFPSSAGGFPSMHPFLGQGFPVPGLSPLGNPMAINVKFDRDGRSEHESMEDDDEDDDDISTSENQNVLPLMSSSPPPSESNHHISPVASRSPQDMRNGEKSPSPESVGGARSPQNQVPVVGQVPRPPSPPQGGSPTPSECNSMGALDLTPRQNQNRPLTSPGVSPGPSPSLFSAFGILPQGGQSPLMSSALSSLTSSVLTSTSFSPLRLAVGPSGNLGRGNTTCNLCFKTFACNSALEIHYRSHTKERPFKCTVCDRGFSTKGNMKQHMLTHKIRDMPQHMFENKSSSVSCEDSTSLPAREQSNDGDVALPPTPTTPAQNQMPTQTSVDHGEQQSHAKRESTETELPLPKRPPSSLQASKHLCHVCNKNFSSSSALQIHMRTHTGDKPFRCTVCQKAFTTKGNLKVHMGTHMWSNGASRRGRRMSLDLPPIPMTPKDSEFLQRRPDLFYPYLPAPFLNGMQQKLNEITSVGPNQNGLTPTAKYGSLLGFGYPPPEAIPSQANSPERASDRPPSESEAKAGLWDLHFQRKNAEAAREDLLPASREGLAA